MRNITGAVATGDDFFNRINEMETLWRDLETDNVLLLAPRRVGKTSLMRKMGADAVGHSFSATYVDVSDCADELRFVQRLYQAILESHTGDHFWNQVKDSWLGKTVKRVQKIGGAGFSLEFGADSDATSWPRLGEELADALSKLDKRWLIQIDELPVFVLKLLGDPAATPEDHAAQVARARVREFLYWMRRLRLQYTGTRWMLAGSIGLDTVTARLNIADSINDLRIVKLGPFDTDTAKALLAALAHDQAVTLNETVAAHIVARAGWPAPYYLQLIFHELRDVKGVVSEAHVDRAIEDLLGPQHTAYFDYWRQRLYDELGRIDADCAVTLLNSACRTPEGMTRSALSMVLARSIAESAARGDKLRYLLDVLENDGYLVHEGDRWLFQFPLLREFWQRRLAPPEDSRA